MLAEIKTEAARHCTVALFSEPFACNPLYLFSPVFSLPSLSPPAFDAHTLSHSIDSSLFSVLTLKLAVLSPGSGSLSCEF